MSCTKRNPQPPCNEDSHVENRNGKECCYKGKKKTSPKKNTVSYDLKKSLDLGKIVNNLLINLTII